VRAEKVNDNKGLHDEGIPRLVRVRWDGLDVSHGIYDPLQRVSAVLEFDRSAKGIFQYLKSTEWALLAPTHSEFEGVMSDKPKTVAPTVKKMERDSSMVTVTFPAGSLARGWCYELQIGTPAFNTEHDLVKEDLNLCMTNCMCDWVGTSKCEEHTGKCHCKFPHTGPDCSQCEKGHTRDPTSGQCVSASVCIEQGGKEDCNGHGICNMRGNAAVCECDPGFINDGLE
jgi:hypothetical protein